VSTCNGPIVPFKGGRIDAWKEGNFGSPQPQQNLATLTESFRNQGFNQTDMIKLVACGHTLGGVRTTDFPQLVPPDPSSTVPIIDNFDETMQFDNLVLVAFSSNRFLKQFSPRINHYKQSYGLPQKQYYKHPSHYKRRRLYHKYDICFGFTRL
jgi:Peroxidase